MHTTMDVTPTWSSLLPAMVAIISDPNTRAESREVILEELARAMRLADAHVSRVHAEMNELKA